MAKNGLLDKAGSIAGKIKTSSTAAVDKLKTGSTAAAAKAGIVDPVKQKRKQLAEEKQKMYSFIGMEVYDIYGEGKIELPEIEPFYNKIKELNAELALLEPAVTSVCECGVTLPPNSKFCCSCGKNLALVSPAAADPVAYCVCGAVIEPDTRMCMECGRRTEVLAD